VELAFACAEAFVRAQFSGEERHGRRLAKVQALDDEAADGVITT